MRIAYLVNVYPKISHTFIRREIQALEDLGIEVRRYSLRRAEEVLVDPVDQAELEKTEVILDRGASGLASALARCAAARPAAFARATALAQRLGRVSDRGLAVHGAYLAEACVLLERLESAGLEHVHVHFGTNSATVALLVAELGGPGYSFVVHGPEEFDIPLQLSLGLKVERSRFVCAISSYGRAQLYRRVGHEHWSKVHVVRCGLDGAFLEEEPPPLPETPRLVNVGRLSEQKGQLLLLQAFAEVRRRGVEAELTLVGDGEFRGALEALIDREGLGDRVTITGWANGEEVKQHLAQGRLFVLPSFAEGLPVVIMEALAKERPVITTYIAGIPELVVPGQSGWLVPAGDVATLADAIVAALGTSTERLHAMGQAGRAAVLEAHDVRKNAAELHRLLQRYIP